VGLGQYEDEGADPGGRLSRCKEIIVQQGKRYKWVFEDDLLDTEGNDGYN
jgi:hypothetical protein